MSYILDKFRKAVGESTSNRFSHENFRFEKILEIDPPNNKRERTELINQLDPSNLPEGSTLTLLRLVGPAHLFKPVTAPAGLNGASPLTPAIQEHFEWIASQEAADTLDGVASRQAREFIGFSSATKQNTENQQDPTGEWGSICGDIAARDCRAAWPEIIAHTLANGSYQVAVSLIGDTIDATTLNALSALDGDLTAIPGNSAYAPSICRMLSLQRSDATIWASCVILVTANSEADADGCQKIIRARLEKEGISHTFIAEKGVDPRCISREDACCVRSESLPLWFDPSLHSGGLPVPDLNGTLHHLDLLGNSGKTWFATGSEGAGKSFLLDKMLHLHLARGGKAIIYDFHGEHSWVGNVPGFMPETMSLVPHQPVPFNFFRLVHDPKHQLPLVASAICAMIDLIGDQRACALVNAAVDRAWERLEARTTIKAVIKEIAGTRLPLADKIVHLLAPWSEGGMLHDWFETDQCLGTSEKSFLIHFRYLDRYPEFCRRIAIATIAISTLILDRGGAGWGIVFNNCDELFRHHAVAALLPGLIDAARSGKGTAGFLDRHGIFAKEGPFGVDGVRMIDTMVMLDDLSLWHFPTLEPHLPPHLRHAMASSVPRFTTAAIFEDGQVRILRLVFSPLLKIDDHAFGYPFRSAWFWLAALGVPVRLAAHYAQSLLKTGEMEDAFDQVVPPGETMASPEFHRIFKRILLTNCHDDASGFLTILALRRLIENASAKDLKLLENGHRLPAWCLHLQDRMQMEACDSAKYYVTWSDVANHGFSLQDSSLLARKLVTIPIELARGYRFSDLSRGSLTDDETLKWRREVETVLAREPHTVWSRRYDDNWPAHWLAREHGVPQEIFFALSDQSRDIILWLGSVWNGGTDADREAISKAKSDYQAFRPPALSLLRSCDLLRTSGNAGSPPLTVTEVFQGARDRVSQLGASAGFTRAWRDFDKL